MDSCVGCHHSPELTQGLVSMRDMANDYKIAISRLITASANPSRIAGLERRAQDLGQELITMTQGMAFTANVRLQQKTQETMSTIREVRWVLSVTLLAGLALAFIIAYTLVKGLGRRLQQLLEATRRIARGELQHRVELTDAPGSEFTELEEAFNTMTHDLHVSQRQLMQSTKLAAIGELATNIAYEVNNPLTGVLGYTSLLLKADDIPADKKEHLRTVERETLRAREILRNLLDFSRRKPPRLIKSSMSMVVQDTIPIVREQAKLSNVVITTFCNGSFPEVAIDVDEIRQVFVNLINNACFAMPKGGSLDIQCRVEQDRTGRQAVIVEFADTGLGIPEEHLDKIFDPFFTTRPDGGSTGLGLSISYMIMQNHGGWIEVESTVDKGSVFKVILPVQGDG
jgi:two-component system NtrC family sensor kinase